MQCATLICSDDSQTGCHRLSWYESVYVQEEQKVPLQIIKDDEEVNMQLSEHITQQNPNFRTNYIVFKSLRRKGWIVKSGLNYGINFVLYQGSPELKHAEYAVAVLPSTDSTFNFRKLLGLNRSCVGAKKVLCFVPYFSPLIIRYRL